MVWVFENKANSAKLRLSLGIAWAEFGNISISLRYSWRSSLTLCICGLCTGQVHRIEYFLNITIIQNIFSKSFIIILIFHLHFHTSNNKNNISALKDFSESFTIHSLHSNPLYTYYDLFKLVLDKVLKIISVFWGNPYLYLYFSKLMSQSVTKIYQHLPLKKQAKFTKRWYLKYTQRPLWAHKRITQKIVFTCISQIALES